MDYIPSNAEDAALHKKFHAMNVGGVDLTKSFVESMRTKSVWSGGNGSFIAVIGRNDSLAARNRATKVLEVVNTELGAVPIGDDVLWSHILSEESSVTPPSAANGTPEGSVATSTAKKPTIKSDRFKVYLYIQGSKCIGLCLAETISEAYAVLGEGEASDGVRQVPAIARSSAISVRRDAALALLGISRIWTSNLHRKKGVARTLLDCARADFLYGLEVPKEKIAFSQPTESGGQLARKWFGKESGWLVYAD